MIDLRPATADDLAAVTALQQAAYAKNRALLGVQPLPLTADYAQVFSAYEIWLAERAHGLDGVLILQARPDDLLIWSVATAPAAQGSGVGNHLLQFAESHARGLGCVASASIPGRIAPATLRGTGATATSTSATNRCMTGGSCIW